jgi:hypothetical protein
LTAHQAAASPSEHRPASPRSRLAWQAPRTWQPSQRVGVWATPPARTQVALAAQQVQASTNPPAHPVSTQPRPAWDPKAWQPRQQVGASATPPAPTQQAWAAHPAAALTSPPAHPASARTRPAWQAGQSARAPRVWQLSQLVEAWATPLAQTQQALAARQAAA